MLVFASDIHLTDGTSGTTIDHGAFAKFARYLGLMAESAGARQIEIVLLGDIFDVIRSATWLKTTIRPWSEEADTDATGKSLKDYALKITRDVLARPNNVKCADHLKDFRKTMRANGIEVTFTYIMGNHDWLINRYPEARIAIAEFLGQDDPASCQDKQFDTSAYWRPYRVFARHGDVYDPFNFEECRDASSLGDAIVIDLLNRFPQAVEDEIGKQTDPDLVKLLREVDNVRPLLDVPLWVDGACRQVKSPSVGKKVKKVWDRLVDRFLTMDFVKERDRPFVRDPVDDLQAALRISKLFRLRTMAEIARLRVWKLFSKEPGYPERAFNEDIVKDHRAQFVVYGHTHQYGIHPLDQCVSDGSVLRKMYFNTGTWRKVYERAKCENSGREFLGWHVMTFIAFYLKKERHSRPFEVWNGALG